MRRLARTTGEADYNPHLASASVSETPGSPTATNPARAIKVPSYVGVSPGQALGITCAARVCHPFPASQPGLPL
jgi:hypothetical protein